MQGALFARCAQFLEGPVPVSVGHQFGCLEDACQSGDHRSWKVLRLNKRMGVVGGRENSATETCTIVSIG